MSITSHVWQHGGVSLSPRCVDAGAGVGGGQEDALGMIFFGINETHYLQLLLLSLVRWLWNSIWKMFVTAILVRCFSALFFYLYMYTYTYRYRYKNCILYFLVLTKPVPVWVPVKASFSTSDTIVTLYRHRSTNRFVPLEPTGKIQICAIIKWKWVPFLKIELFGKLDLGSLLLRLTILPEDRNGKRREDHHKLLLKQTTGWKVEMQRVDTSI